MCAVVNFARVRLVGGRNSREGRLEIFHINQWGTVCDDSFDDVDARVACNSLGFGFDYANLCTYAGRPTNCKPVPGNITKSF